jgi:glycosyltransferase involved in cell wall biosynthesis
MQGGVEVRRVACIGTLLYTPLSPTLPIELSRTLREFDPDLVHLHLPNPSCFAVLASARARRQPWIVHWHAEVPADAPSSRLRAAYRVYRPFEQALLKRASAIVTTSQPYLDASPALAPWRAKTRVIPLGIADIARTSPRADLWPEGDGVRVLAVGRLSHYKGFDVLVDALAKAPHVRVLLVGEGECADSLRARAAERGVASRIHFAGGLDDATLLAAYASADVFALPSLNRGEAFGMVLLEAMRARLPIVASAIPGSGVSEVVADGETGVLVKPGDADALAVAFERLDDADVRARLGKAGRARFERQFTLDRSAASWFALYRELTA